MGCVACAQLHNSSLKALNGEELLNERSKDDPRLRENLLSHRAAQDPYLVLEFCSEGCIRSTDASNLDDPNRVRGNINTGIVDIDGDGVEPLELVSAIFMGHPSDQPAVHQPAENYRRSAFRSFQADYKTHQIAETECEEIEFPVNRFAIDLTRFNTQSLGGMESFTTDGLMDPNRSRGGINTGIVDVDGDGVEAMELISAIFMGYPGGQPQAPPIDPEYFNNTQRMYNEQLVGEQRAEERAITVLLQTSTGNTPAAFKKQVAFEMLAEELEEFPPPLTEQFGGSGPNSARAGFLEAKENDILSTL